ncbi:unnamed protein product [Chrysodeixis includens]|uniref:UDP-glucuronosyltransferase n=1 Tax=Chrysodeixis includens TaxID=689277 RepID=A0A9N8Q1Q1_CHRIL|nr:unnamed protein product [Chrysodeixis includens]
MATLRLNIILVLIHQVFFSDAARILAVYPTPSISHQVVFRPITQELLKRGHEVVVVTPDPMYPKGQAPENLTEIDVHDVGYSALQGALTSSKMFKDNFFAETELLMTAFIKTIDKILDVNEVKELLKGEQHFDLLITEHCVRVAAAFSYVYKKPLIEISSFGAMFGTYGALGAPTHPFLYPTNMYQRIYNLTMLEKLDVLYTKYKVENIMKRVEIIENRIIKKYFPPDTPPAAEVQRNVDMLFLNLNPIWEGNQPVPPNVIHLGGLPYKPNKPLPKELQSYLDSSKNGVIYISFGTNVKTSILPPERVKHMINAFSKLPYDILWKWDSDNLPGKAANIRISKWLPQSDLLKHPKIKLFITQGGLQSADETITAGVPTVVVPMLGDQWYNAEKYVHHGIGVKLEAKDITEESFSKAINTVIGNKSYRENIIKLRDRMHDQPQKPLERAMWWIEYVMRHGGAKHLRSPAAFITWREYLELDLVAVVLTVLISIILVIVFILYSLYKLLVNKNKTGPKVKKN